MVDDGGEARRDIDGEKKRDEMTLTG